MSNTQVSGPVVSTGNLNPSRIEDADCGPDLAFQGTGIIDPRMVGLIGAAPGRKINALYTNPYLALVDCVPITAAVANIAAAANVVTGTAMTLVTANAAGISPKVPIVPFGLAYNSANVVTPALALDFGFTTGTTVVQAANNVTTIPAAAMKFLKAGMPLVISSGAAAGVPLITVVQSVDVPNTRITVFPAPTNAAAGLQLGTADLSGIAAWPYAVAGVDAFPDPTQAVSRAVSITGSASATGGNFFVRGYDFWGVPLEETIAAGAGAATTNGKKAFKYITSVTPQFTDAHNYSVGTTDIFGLNLRADFWEYMNIFWNGAFVSVSTGWTAALGAGVAATANNADVRGTYAVQSASDSTKRLAVFMSLASYNALNSTNLDSTTLFGAAQFFQ